MTFFLDFRTDGVGGGILDEPRVLEGNGLVDPPELRHLGQTLPADRIGASARIGIGYAAEPWRDRPWRFFDRESAAVSGPATRA